MVKDARPQSKRAWLRIAKAWREMADAWTAAQRSFFLVGIIVRSSRGGTATL